EVVRTLGVNLEQVIAPKQGWDISSGIEAYYDRVGSEAFRLDLRDSSTMELRGLYPDGANAWNVAAYSLHRWKRNQWRLEAGLRYNWFRLESEAEQLGAWVLRPQALVGQASVRRDWSPRHHAKLSLQRGFRAPNLYDLSSVGSFDLGIEVPNAALRPEKNWTLEWSERFRASNWQGGWTLFATRLTDLIGRLPAQYQGLDSLDGQAVFIKTNIGQAIVAGAEAQCQWRLTRAWTLQTSLTYTFGQTLEEEPVPLSKMPPLFGQTGILWQENGWELQLLSRFAAAQRRLSPEDMLDPIVADGGTNAWISVDVRLGYVGEWWEARLGLQNVMNQAYRYHGSGVDAYGRSGWVSLAVRL
ncbi:MAG: TonB-dependent receptor, partial [Bacteroidota bacterium]